jgi:hypothetical protein
MMDHSPQRLDRDLFRLFWKLNHKRVFQPRSETVEIAVDYRRDVQRQCLRHEEAADYSKP